MANPLARVVMDNISKKSQKDFVNRDSIGDSRNLTRKDEDIIKNIIHNEARIQSNTANKKMITLEELARMVKGQ